MPGDVMNSFPSDFIALGCVVAVVVAIVWGKFDHD